jgi:phytanoyl-CoA hydroxylase
MGIESVDEEAVQFYKDNGYLAVEGLFSPDEVESYRQGLADLIDGKNPEYQGLQGEGTAGDVKPGSQEFKDAIRKLHTFTDYDQRLAAMLTHERFISVVEKLLDGKSKLSQQMALLKPPRIGREKPWHQDHAYFNIDLNAPVVGCWIAIDEATIANGCMHILPGQHKSPRLHFRVRDWQICDTEMLDTPSTAVPLKPGGVLFFSSFLPHGTPTNNSNTRRWAVQLHYRREDSADISNDARLEVFGSEGKDVSC